MLSIFVATLSPMLCLFTCIVIGYVLHKEKILPENSDTVISKLENYVICPALTIYTFLNQCTVQTLIEHSHMMVYSAFIVMIALIFAYLLAGYFEKDSYKKKIYRYAIAFGNFGFMGNAIIPVVLGEEMLYDYMLFTIPLSLVVNTWGISSLIPSNEEHHHISFKNILNPAMIALLIGMMLGLSGMHEYMPRFILTALSNLGSCMGPLAMVLTGFVIGKYDLKEMLLCKKIYVVTFLRLIVLPIIYVGILMIAQADIKTITLGLFAFMMPLGLNTVVFPAAYGGDTSTGGAMAIISHTLCVITIPIMYALFMILIG